MVLKLYCNDMDPGVRAVLLTAKAVGVDFELKEIDIYSKERITELLEINPQHTVPTLIDRDFILRDCHAIATYLIANFATSDALYPTDIKTRALVDQHLHLDSSILHPPIQTLIYSIAAENEKIIPSDRIAAITQAYCLLDVLLKEKDYFMGEALTVADLCCVATISTATLIIPVSTEKYPHLSGWYRRCKALPFYEEANGVGLNRLDSLVELKLGRPRVKDLCE